MPKENTNKPSIRIGKDYQAEVPLEPTGEDEANPVQNVSDTNPLLNPIDKQVSKLLTDINHLASIIEDIVVSDTQSLLTYAQKFNRKKLDRACLMLEQARSSLHGLNRPASTASTASTESIVAVQPRRPKHTFPQDTISAENPYGGPKKTTKRRVISKPILPETELKSICYKIKDLITIKPKFIQQDFERDKINLFNQLDNPDWDSDVKSAFITAINASKGSDWDSPETIQNLLEGHFDITGPSKASKP